MYPSASSAFSSNGLRTSSENVVAKVAGVVVVEVVVVNFISFMIAGHARKQRPGAMPGRARANAAVLKRAPRGLGFHMEREIRGAQQEDNKMALGALRRCPFTRLERRWPPGIAPDDVGYMSCPGPGYKARIAACAICS